MKSPTPPPPPDPVQTAKAQTDSNVKTATTSQQLNMVDQTNPYGTQTYNQNGTWADGTPKFSMNTTLSAPEQAKQNQQWEFDSLTNQLGIDQTKKIGDHLNKPIDFGQPLDFGPALDFGQSLDFGTPMDFGAPIKIDNEATESRLFELGRKRLDPLWQQKNSALENKLYNQGHMPGTEGWKNAMAEASQQENDAYNSLLLAGRGQAADELVNERNLRNYEMLTGRTLRNDEMMNARKLRNEEMLTGRQLRNNEMTTSRDMRNNEMLTMRNQPINEITALMSGGQVQQPQFSTTPQTTVAGTDIAGLTMDAYKYGPLAQYQAQQASNDAMMSGLFSLGGAALGGWGKNGFAKPKGW